MKKKTGLFLIIIILGSCAYFKKPSFPVEQLHYPDSLHVVLRSDWGWKPLTGTIPEHRIKRITIHHGGVDFNRDEDPVQYIRHLQDWSRAKKNWIDIPYHFMIDLDGRIYEARPINYPGDTNTTYNPRGHALICVMGNYEHQIINRKQLTAVVDLCAYLAEHFHVPPSQIKGHKDYAETLCPGKNLYLYIRNGYIQNKVKEILNRENKNHQKRQ